MSLIALLSLVLAASSSAHAETPVENFLWGVANSSFQAEGHPADSDWNRFHRLPWMTQDGSTADVATDFWNRYDEDFALAQAIGLNAFRISIAWERIEPQKNVWDEEALSHYETMLAAMRARGLEPVVTLHHFPMPIWLAEEKGALSPEFEQEFAAYAKKVVSRLAAPPAAVSYWITFNEALSMVNGGYVWGGWPPDVKGGFNGGLDAQGKFALAHIEAVRAIRELNLSNVKIGIAQAWQAYAPQKPENAQDRIASDFAKWHNNEYLIRAILTGNTYFGKSVKLPQGGPPLDFIGLNYYTRYFAKSKSEAPFFELWDGPKEKTELGWEICPEEMLDALQDASKFGVPVMITENGLGDSKDAQRGKFIADHLASVRKAREAKIPLLGYLHWSLTDNFEWGCGLACRFGMVEIDYTTLERKPRPSYYRYGELIHEMGF